MPVTIPDEEPIEQTAGLPLSHVPPAGTHVNVVVDPTQAKGAPVITPGSAFTVTVIVLLQPVAVMKQVIVAVPAAAPVTIPVPTPTVAIAVLLLLHVHPAGVVVSVVVRPTHKLVLPVIGVGNGLTVTVAVAAHVVGNVYVIVAVPGAGVEETPLTSPVPATTVAIAVLLLVHTPPVGELPRAVVCPSHTVGVPVIADGNGFTERTVDVLHPVTGAV